LFCFLARPAFKKYWFDEGAHAKLPLLCVVIDDGPVTRNWTANRPASRLASQTVIASVLALFLVGEDGSINVRRARAVAAVETARLNVEYCIVRAPVSGYVTNLNIAVGEFTNLGEGVFDIVDDSRWYVLANFRETLLSRIKPGMVAEGWLLACPGKPLRGVVEGVGKAIYQIKDGNMDLMADVPAELDWVRLAQRFPVRIILEASPDCSFHSGGTATVRLDPQNRVGETRNAVLDVPIATE
jgi:multidrug efflux system membrane fusion protein